MKPLSTAVVTSLRSSGQTFSIVRAMYLLLRIEKKIVQRVKDHFGRLHVLVNNAESPLKKDATSLGPQKRVITSFFRGDPALFTNTWSRPKWSFTLCTIFFYPKKKIHRPDNRERLPPNFEG